MPVEWFLQEMCHQAKLEYAEETCKANELHDRLATERKQARYDKHYDICQQVRYKPTKATSQSSVDIRLNNIRV
jgi:hypothetical protein